MLEWYVCMYTEGLKADLYTEITADIPRLADLDNENIPAPLLK